MVLHDVLMDSVCLSVDAKYGVSWWYYLDSPLHDGIFLLRVSSIFHYKIGKNLRALKFE
jgi:hypothetical protein